MKSIVSCLCVCLYVLTVNSQDIRRPEVQALPIDDNEMTVIIAACRSRIALNSSVTHYVSVPSDCSAYAVCEHPELGVIPALMNCPSGLFFDDSLEPNVLTCNRPGLVECLSAVDPCTGRNDGYNEDFVRSQATQAAYYLCRNGRTVEGGWCEQGEQYGTFDVPCFPIPGYIPPQTTQAADPGCGLGEVPNDISKFSLGGFEMSCALGTVFDLQRCGCVMP